MKNLILAFCFGTALFCLSEYHETKKTEYIAGTLFLVGCMIANLILSNKSEPETETN